MENNENKTISRDLMDLTARLMLSRTQKEIAGLASEFGALVERVIEAENKASVKLPFEKESAVTATIKFTAQETAGMEQNFRKRFAEQGNVARVIKRRSGEKKATTYVYEIRYRRDGLIICKSSKDLKEAKRQFLEATKPENIDRYAVNGFIRRSGKDMFWEIAAEWLKFKENKLCERTHANYESYYRRYIAPVLGNRPIAAIRTIEIDQIMRGKEGKLYEDLRGILNMIFKYAIASGVITYNPVLLIPFKKAERKSERRALTIEEQKRLIARLNLPEFKAYKRVFLTMLYFGLRPCELNGASFEGDFLVTRNAKRKNGKIEYKKIPIAEQARAQIETQGEIRQRHDTATLNRIFKRIIGDEKITQYYLRHTFATVCQQYVRPDIVDIWMGDSPERLVGRVYTHFSDEFMQEQMNRVKFEV